MNKTRLEAFSDGVLAIIITIMVLELKMPQGEDWAAIKPVLPTLGSYVLSFAVIGIYWGNHHHLLHTVRKVNGPVIWANLHLLFWLSLVPFATMWMGQYNFSSIPVAIYGTLLILCGLAFGLLSKVIAKEYPTDSRISEVFKKAKTKERISTVLYFLSVPLAFIDPFLSGVIFAIVALMWIIPIKEIEEFLSRNVEG